VRACIETGRRLQVPVIDCFSEHTAAIQEGIDPKDLFTDGLHYSPAGYRVRSPLKMYFLTYSLSTIYS
jgi:lysophospholipase L1-like esterase